MRSFLVQIQLKPLLRARSRLTGGLDNGVSWIYFNAARFNVLEECALAIGNTGYAKIGFTLVLDILGTRGRSSDGKFPPPDVGIAHSLLMRRD